MSLMTTFLEKVIKHLQKIHDEEEESIYSAAQLISNEIKKDKLIHVFGPGGHSNLASQEVFYRAGGLMHINAILDEGTLLSNGATRSTLMERTLNYGKNVIINQDLKKDDLLILINAFGINAAVIDAALEAKNRGVKLIGISSTQYGRIIKDTFKFRHPSGYKLSDLVDITIDSKIETGDAILEIEGCSQKVASISTFANIYILHCLMSIATESLVKEGITPPIWMSNNVPGGDEMNASVLKNIKGKIKYL